MDVKMMTNLWLVYFNVAPLWRILCQFLIVASQILDYLLLEHHSVVVLQEGSKSETARIRWRMVPRSCICPGAAEFDRRPLL